jgi:hypothetical protein
VNHVSYQNAARMCGGAPVVALLRR